MKHFNFTLIFTLLFFIGYSQCEYEENVPDELYRGRYSVADMNYGSPYTMFNKRKSGWTLEGDLAQIRQNILNGEPEALEAFKNEFARLYYAIYNSANNIPEPPRCFQYENCDHPGWVKNNAIVHLIGIKAFKVGNDVKFTYISDVFDTARYRFATAAAAGLSNLNPHIVGCRGGFDSDCDRISLKALGLLHYLQAYDALKAAGYYRANDGDRNGGNCSARNKLREYSRNLYVQGEDIINSFYGWKKNHGIICASVLGVASIVLNDAGVETNYFNGLFGFFGGKGVVLARPTYSPEKWHLRADGNGGYSWFGGEDGLEDNMFKGDHARPANDVPMTNSDGTAGYAEGPGYAQYMMQALVPYMRAADNFFPEWQKRYINDPRYQNILEWYKNIQTQTGVLPSYDNSGTTGNLLGVLGMEKWQGVGGTVPGSMEADYLLACGAIPDAKGVGSPVLPALHTSDASGNAVLRATDGRGKHYFHMLYETGAAVTPAASGLETVHEEEDLGSFMIRADNEWLMIDPPYLGFDFVEYTRSFYCHNYATFGSNKTFNNPVISDTSSQENHLGFKLSYNVDNGGDVSRQVRTFITNDRLYYVLNDRFTNGTGNGSPRIALNGNGNVNESTFFRTNSTGSEINDPTGKFYKWKHPCVERIGENPWSLLSHTSFLDVATPAVNLESGSSILNIFGFILFQGTEHGQARGNEITTSKGVYTKAGEESHEYGLHTKVELTQPVNNTVFQNVLMPYKCSDVLPDITEIETSTYVSTIIKFAAVTDTVPPANGLAKAPPVYITDTVTDFHLSRIAAGTSNVTNPLQLSLNGGDLEAYAEDVFMSASQFVFERPGACSPSHIAFRQAEITKGTTLEYNDTMYISATSPATVYYTYTSKFRYTGSVNSPSGITVTFFMPDMQRYYQMHCVRDKFILSTTHHYTAGNDSFKYVTVSFPAGTTNFTLELADPCLADCYFPPTDITIDSTYTFDTGLLKTLGHDLDVVAPNGLLRVSQASKMSICENFVFVNKDSIILIDSVCREKKKIVSSGYDGVQTTITNTTYLNGTKDFSNRNAIIVNNKAGLVLDSGSYTQIGTLSTILIRKGGTLLVKKGATLVIGSDCADDRGELIAEDGSYVCIEDSSDIHFFNDIDPLDFALGKDTIDRHIFYISRDIGDPAITGVNTAGGNGRFRQPVNQSEAASGVGRWADNSCLQLCLWKYVNLPYGVNNREFGWCNVSYPRSSFEMSYDTICVNSYIVMNAEKTLNETSFDIKACSYDTSAKACISTLMDSTGIANDSIRPGAGIALFRATTPGHYQVRLIAKNDCNERDTSYRIVYVVPDPYIEFTLSDSLLCPGAGVLTADGSNSYSGLPLCRHEWGIDRVMTDTTIQQALDDESSSMTWLNDSATVVDSSFNFPGYRFQGGYQYLVSLTIQGKCGAVSYYDTVNVPLKVEINLDTTRSYSTPVGPAPVQLIGTVSGATGWNWNPTTYLSSSGSLTPIATPPDSIKYVLTGISASCTARDTVTIRKNKVTYAGADTCVCYGECLVLGTNFNAAIFLGYLNYSSNGALAAIYATYPGLRFDKHFTGFMIKQLSMYLSSPLIATFTGIDSTRNYLMKRDWFFAYYASFISSTANISSLNHFVTQVNSDAFIKSRLDGVSAKPKWNATVVGQIFTAYRTYVNTAQYTNLLTQWDKRTDTATSWTTRTDGAGFFNLMTCDPSDSIFRVRVTDSGLGVVEYDEVTVKEDSVTVPYFGIAYQMDSTIYFDNYTEPDKGWNDYSWNFGDGSALSTARYPVHTFPAFDSAYVVCLTVTTMCGDSQYCDTVRVDSTLLAYGGFGKTGLLRGIAEKQKEEMNQARLSAGHYLSVNIPNPFSDASVITYAVHGGYRQAGIRITNTLGQHVKTYDLRDAEGNLIVDGSALKRGMYYYSLIIDGAVYESKAMVIER